MSSKYHVLLLWPSDLAKEAREVRKFFKDFNKTTAKKTWGVTFELVDYCTTGEQQAPAPRRAGSDVANCAVSSRVKRHFVRTTCVAWVVETCSAHL